MVRVMVVVVFRLLLRHRPQRDDAGHVLQLHHRGVLLRAEQLPSVQPSSQNGRGRFRWLDGMAICGAVINVF